ncbi:MAG TPA: protein kinase, partial [Candidatus Acidoferrum sp.]|nr:protein kinase [Candidatus Acidoferrum sp.]
VAAGAALAEPEGQPDGDETRRNENMRRVRQPRSPLAYTKPIAVHAGGAARTDPDTAELEHQEFSALLSAAPAPAEPPEARIGSVVGSYRLLEVIGRGGMGCVYRAEHVKLGRDVALKLLREDYAQRRDSVTRFFQEARAVNLIRHRNIVDIYDYVELKGGTVFIIMELLAGYSLGRLMRGPIQLARALGILAQICDGLSAAHTVGIVHRDLKPDNIIIVRSPEGGDLVKILDFGVAKLADKYASGVDLTAVGSVIGTPAYMSPEQAGGLPVDARSDVYSLGAIMYELFTHQTMFRGDSFGDFVRQHLNDAPVPPGRVPGCHEIDPDLEATILRCVAKGPDSRFQSAQELRSRLLALLAGRDGRPESDPDAESPTSLRWTEPPSSGFDESGVAEGSGPGDAAAVRAAPSPLPGPGGVPEGASAAPPPSPIAFGTPSPYLPSTPRTPDAMSPDAMSFGATPTPVPAPVVGRARRGLVIAVAIAFILVAVVIALLVPLLTRDRDSRALAEGARLVASDPAGRDDATSQPATEPGYAAAPAEPALPPPMSRPEPPRAETPPPPDAPARTRHGTAKSDDRGRRPRPREARPELPPVQVHIWSRPVAELHALGRHGALCQTPCALTINPGDGGSSMRRVYLIKKPGYQTEKIIIDLDSPPRQVRIDLQKLRDPGDSDPDL